MMRRAIVPRRQLGRNGKVPDISVRMRQRAARAGQSAERDAHGEHAMHKQVLASITLAAIVGVPSPSAAQDIPAEYQQVLSTLGKQGDYKDRVLKVNIPRNDLKVTVAGVSTPTPFGFGGWVAMTKGDGGHQVLMGDLVLVQDEVNPVMSALLDNGLDVTALHNHFFWDEPRIFYMHVHGHGTAAELAQKLKPAVDLIGKGAPGAAPAAASPAPA